MDINILDAFFENILGGGGGTMDPGEGPEPLNRRFNWVDPVTGKRPPKPPKAMLPGKRDFKALEPKGPVNVPIRHITPGDREGRYSMHDMIPPEELATMNHLLDLKLRAQKAEDPTQRAALNKEWEAHRSEFESLLTKALNTILE